MSYGPGVYYGIPNADYHAAPGESASNIAAAGVSLANYIWQKKHKRKETPAMRLGTAVHAAILEPNLFESTYVARPDGMRSDSKAYETLQAQHPGKILLGQSDMDMIRGMRDAALAHEMREYLTLGKPEVSVFGIDPETGELLKCRPDRLIADAGLTVNLKTCADATEHGFFKSVADYQYDWSSAFYCDLLKLHYGSDFDEVHFLIEKEPPYHIGVYSIAPESLDYARAQYRGVLKRLAHAKQTNEWPGLPPVLKVLTLPTWAQKQPELV